MAVLKLSKKDITKNDEKEKKLTLKKSDITYDSAIAHGWETSYRESFDILNRYSEKISNNEWLSEEDRQAYRSALDSYIETSNKLRGISKILGDGGDEEDEQTWLDSVSSMNTGFEDIANYYSQWGSEDDYKKWHEEAQKAEEFKSVLTAEDYEANKGYVPAEEPTDFWGKLFGRKDKTYEYVNNQNDYRSEYKHDYVTYSRDNPFAEAESDFEQKGYDFLTDEEVGIYNYYYSTKGKEKAQEYLDSMEKTLVQRKAGKEFEALEGNTLKEIFYGAVAGTEQFRQGVENLGSAIMGDEGFTPSSQYVSGMVRDDLADNGFEVLGSSVGQAAYDLVNTTANMLPSVLVGAATGGLGGAITLGASASGNAYTEMRNLGYDAWQARAYAGLVGASEAALSYALGGISKLGGGSGGIFQTVASKVVPKLDNAIARVAIQLGGNMIDEGLEEAIQEVLDPVFKMVATGEDFEGIDLEAVLYSGLLGALSAGFMEGIPSIAGTVGSNIAAKNTYGYNDGVDLVYKALSTDPDNAHARRMKARLDAGKNISGYQLNRLAEDSRSAFSKQNQAEATALAEERLTTLGEKGDVKRLAEIVAKAQSGRELTKAERKALVASTYGRRVSDELNSDYIEAGSTSSDWAMPIQEARRKFNQEMYDLATQKFRASESTGDTAATAADAMVTSTETAMAQPATTSEAVSTNVNAVTELPTEVKLSENGVTTVGDAEVKIEEIASVKDGEVTLRLDNGETVNYTDVSFGTEGEALLYANVADMGLNAAAANAFVKGYDMSEGLSVQEYALGFREAYRYGEYGFPAQEMSKEGFSAGLNEAKRSLAYNLGKTDAKHKVNEAHKALPKAKADAKFAKGTMSIEEAMSTEGLTEVQTESLKGIKAVADSLGTKIRFFESKVGADGKRKGANGWFDPDTDTIYIDLYAGQNGEGTMLFTAAHELTHFIRRWSPAKFKVFADFLLEQYGKKGVSVDALVREQIRKAKNNGRDISYDTAYEEVIADSCETMLADGKVISKIAKLKAKDQSLWEKIKDFITDLVKKIKSVYNGLSPNSAEGRYVSEMLDAATKLRNLWTTALADASTNYEAFIGERNLSDFAEAKNENGEPLFQYRAMEADEGTYRQMLSKWGKMSSVQIDNLFATIDNAMELIKDNLEALDYAWEADIDDRAFSPVKPNSDKLYQVSLDFSTLCRKRLLQQMVQEQLQEALNKPLTREEGIAIRDALIALQEEGRQIEVACALCYVESARMKSPEQIKRFMDNKEKVIKEFFAGKSGGNIKEKLKQAEADARENLHKENPEGILGKDGKTMLDPRNASLKQLPKKYADAIRDAKRSAKESYKPTAEEQKLIEIAKGMTVSDFTSPEGLENLAKKYPRLFDAYTSYVRNATKSKGIEGDTWWRAGDSAKIGDVLIANMNRENGMRSQSWSDFQVIHILDYIASTIELATRNAKEQAYSKVPDYVELMGQTGVMINMSLIPTAAFTGTLEYDSVEGIDYKRALALRDKYHKTAGTICIGVNNKQIQLLLADATIDYVIPYHKSGMSKAVRKLMHIPTWDQYEEHQSEKSLSRAEAKKRADKYGVTLLPESDPNYHKPLAFSDWFDLQEAQQIAKMENANPTDKAMQKKYGVMYGGYKAMQNAANNYLKMTAARGLSPKFSHEKADFTIEDNYWKLLIDRKMVDNVTGEIIEQQTIKPIFNEGEVMRILNDEVARYPKVKADQDFAIRTVTEKMLSGEVRGGMSAEAIAKVMKKPVDNVTNVNILASAEEVKLSDRDSLGTELSAEQIEFFKDSKARDEDGNLLVLYHGTSTEHRIAEFLTTEGWRTGLWLSTDHETAVHFARAMEYVENDPRDETKLFTKGNSSEGTGRQGVYELYANVKNPLIVDAKGKRYWEIPRPSAMGEGDAVSGEEINAFALENGYDGVIINDVVEGSNRLGTDVIVFAQNQVKYTDNLTPTESNDIRYSDRDSLGNELSAEQQEYFKDSKVRDKKGNLIVLYHGTTANFNTFKKGDVGFHFGTKGAARGRVGFGKNVILKEVYLNITNPIVFDEDLGSWDADWRLTRELYDMGILTQAEAESVLLTDNRMYKRTTEAANKKLASVLLDKGYDGIQYSNTFETQKATTSYIVFNSNQAKEITNKTPTSNPDLRYSDRDSYAPTFYSHMGNVIDGIKIEKMGANGVVSYLKGRGVKDEEIKWSGIEAFLEGKKSVTKAELQEFVAGSQLVIEEENSADTDTGIKLIPDSKTGDLLLYIDGNLEDTFFKNEDGVLESRETDYLFSNERMLLEAYEEDYGRKVTRWSQYQIGGGSNYRELVFKLANSTYSNRAMRGHWGQEAEGVLAHTRIKDMTTSDGKKMLFIEEIQSDWHNEGREKGYTTKEYEDAVESQDRLYNEYKKLDLAFHKYVRSNEFMTDPEDVRKKKHDWLRGKVETAQKKHVDAEKVVDSLKAKGMGDVPDAPFRNNYHEYVLKRLLRMAAEEGYDSIGWTTADIQSKRWSADYAEGYRIEYDQDIPKFLRKYGKKWGATVEKIDIVEGKNLAELESDLLQMEAQADGADGAERRLLENNIAIYKDRIDNLKVGVGTDVVWSMDITDSMTESVLYEGQVMYSDRVTDQETLEFLENQEHITTYKSFVEIDGKLYSPMATKVKGEDGKYRLTNPSEIGVWQQAEEKPESIPKFHKSGYGYYVLKKDDGGSITAAYNPYEHSSNLVLNDQFEAAYQRPNLVTVECIIPKSEMTSGYKAKYAKDSTGYLDWKSGTVAGKLKGNKRKVYLSRWLKPVRILSDAEVANMYKDILGTKISVPFNVVTPQLRAELEKVGVKIDYEGSPGYQYRQSKKTTDSDAKLSDRDTDSVSNRSLLAGALVSVAQNDIERNKLEQYKQKIALIESEQKKLAELREKIKELSFAKGARDTEAIKKLQFEANQAASRINTYDKQLLTLESTKALKGVLEREKEMARKRAEQKGKDALKAYKEKAARTQRELLTRYQESRKTAIEGRHKTEMRHKIKSVVSDLNKLLLNPTKDQHVPIGLQLPVAEALDAINMDTMNAEERVAYYNALIAKATDPDEIAALTKKRDFFEYRDANFKDRITALRNAYAEFKQSDDPLVRNAHNEAIEDLIKNTADMVGNTSLKNMSLAQLEAVYDMYKAILATVRNANKTFKQGRQATITENSEAVKTEVQKVGGHKERIQKLTKGVKDFNWNLLKPIYAMKTIGSDTLTSLYENVRAGEDTYAVDVTEAKAFFEEVSKKYGYDSWDYKKSYSFKDSVGNEFSLSLEQIMSLYAYSKREQADKHLEFGGFVFDDSIEVTEKKLGIPMKYEVNDATPYRLKKEDLATVIASLSQAQKGFIDEMQTYLSEVMGEKGNEVSLAMYDIRLYKEKHYFPLKTSRYFREYNPEQSGNPMLRNSGFSKKTVPQAGNPIVLSNFMDVWTSHVNDMSMYHSFVLPLEDFMRVYNYSSTAGGYDSVQQYIKNAYGASANKYVEKLMQDINGGVITGNISNGWLKMFGKFKKATVAASLSTVVQQPTAVIRAMGDINPLRFVGVPFKEGHKKTWNEIKKYAPVAIIKEMGGFDVGSGKQARDYIAAEHKGIVGKAIGKIDNAFMWGATKADEWGWNAIWKAVKREVASKQKLKPGTDEFFKACGKRFTEVITQTQVYDSVFSRSGLMRDKGDLNKFATSFMGEPTTSYNMLYGAVLDAKRGGSKAKAAAKIAAVFSSIVAAAAAASAIYALRDDDDDESYAEKYAEAFGNKISSEIWIHNMIPYVRDIASIIEGWDVERPDMSIFSDIKSSFDKLYKVNEDGEYEWRVDFSNPEEVYIATENFGGSIAATFGVPVKNIMRDTRGIYNGVNALTDDIKPKYVGDAFVRGFTGEDKDKGEALYKAIVDGDEGRLKIYRSNYKDESSYNSAVRKALRENDPRIREAAEAQINKNQARRIALAKEIIAEGNFKQDIVVAAINAEVSYLEKQAKEKD